jgi:Fe2+ or Zn2+ uptake regulation protein
VSIAGLLAEDRRLVILRALAEDHDAALNERLLSRVLQRFGHDVSFDVLRGDLHWLADQGLIRIETLPGQDGGVDLWVAHARDDGLGVARGRPHPGVARVRRG